ncbi:hypothetical protein TNCT_643251 [Trichonephila clavata]|uniref:Uncharacterized protein n=1 Tax=Trichonephila clavata TaxID=2740835 RepID=A0A8X6KK70_TRICU|nr:hypothetical protein TNCT_643251 [Trichonephila clavata]
MKPKRNWNPEHWNPNETGIRNTGARNTTGIRKTGARNNTGIRNTGARNTTGIRKTGARNKIISRNKILHFFFKSFERVAETKLWNAALTCDFREFDTFQETEYFISSSSPSKELQKQSCGMQH